MFETNEFNPDADGFGFWTTKDNVYLLISEISDNHLDNVIKLLKNKHPNCHKLNEFLLEKRLRKLEANND